MSPAARVDVIGPKKTRTVLLKTYTDPQIDASLFKMSDSASEFCYPGKLSDTKVLTVANLLESRSILNNCYI